MVNRWSSLRFRLRLPGLVGFAAVAVVALRHRLPLLGHGDHGAGVQHSVAEEVVEFEAHAVHLPLEVALGVVEGIAFGRQYGEMLNVAPGEISAEKKTRRRKKCLKKNQLSQLFFFLESKIDFEKKISRIKKSQ